MSRILLGMLTKHVDSSLIENLRHHQGLGFDIYLFLDADPAISAEMPAVTAFKQWQQADYERLIPGETKVLMRKQTICMTAGAEYARQQGYDFFGFIDEDELIQIRNRTRFYAELDAVPHSLNLQTAEAVCTMAGRHQPAFAARHFLHPTPFRRLRGVGPLLLGASNPTRKFGLQGHYIGKTLYRVPIDLPIWNQHAPARAGARRRPMWVSKAAHLAHYDSNNLEKWQQKWQLRLSKTSLSTKMRGNRLRQFECLQAAEDLEAAFAKYWCLSEPQLARLQRLGLLMIAPETPDQPWVTPWGVPA